MYKNIYLEKIRIVVTCKGGFTLSSGTKLAKIYKPYFIETWKN